MSKICQITGKRPLVGHKVSHSNIKSKRRFLPNLQKKRFFLPSANQWITLRLSAKAIRDINKIGLEEVLQREGIKVPTHSPTN